MTPVFQGTGCPFYLALSFLLWAIVCLKLNVASAFPAIDKPIRPESRLCRLALISHTSFGARVVASLAHPGGNITCISRTLNRRATHRWFRRHFHTT